MVVSRCVSARTSCLESFERLLVVWASGNEYILKCCTSPAKDSFAGFTVQLLQLVQGIARLASSQICSQLRPDRPLDSFLRPNGES